MWGQLNQIAAAAKQAAKTVASEAAATVQELREVHKEEWSRRRDGWQPGQPDPQLALAPPTTYAVQQAGPFDVRPVPVPQPIAHALQSSAEGSELVTGQPFLNRSAYPGSHVPTYAGATAAQAPAMHAEQATQVVHPAQPEASIALAAPLSAANQRAQSATGSQAFPPAVAQRPSAAAAPPSPTAAVSDVSSRLAALKAKLQADKARLAPGSRTVSIAGSSQGDTPRKPATSCTSPPEVTAPAVQPNMQAAASLAASSAACLPTEQPCSPLEEQQWGQGDENGRWAAQAVAGQQVPGGEEGGGQGQGSGASPRSTLFQAYHPAAADHKPEQQHSSWLPKPVPFQRLQQANANKQQEQRQQQEEPARSICLGGTALDSPTGGSANGGDAHGISVSTPADSHSRAPFAEGVAPGAQAAAASRDEMKQAAVQAGQEEASLATVAAEAGKEEMAALAARLIDLERVHQQAAARAEELLQAAQAEAEAQRQAAALAEERLDAERRQQAQAVHELQAARQQLAHLATMHEAEQAQQAQLVQQLAEAAAAAAQLEEERRQHGVTQQHLADLQSAQGQSTDRCDRLEASVSELQQLLVQERQARQQVEVQLAAGLQAEQQAEVDEALEARDVFWKQQLAEQCSKLQAALADRQQLAAELGHLRPEAAQVAGLRAQLQAAQQQAAESQHRTAQLEADVASLHTALIQAQAAAGAGAVASSSDVEEVGAQLEAARRECARLQQEVGRLQAGQQEAMAAASGSDGVATQLQHRVAELEAALAAAEADRAGQRQQLARLKQQMLSEQEDEEDKVRWRVEAEVRMELEKRRGTEGGGEGSALGQELAAARERCAALEADAAKWEAALAARDVELQNLQHALGELSYESEAAERMRSELRAMQAEAHSLRNELDAAKLQHMRLQEEAAGAQAAAQAAQQQLQAQREAEGLLQAEALSLRRALGEAQRKLHALTTDTGSMIDRRIVVKMLITYFEKDYSGEVLELMCSMLGFTPEDRAKISESRRRQGWRDISLASDVRPPLGPSAKQSLADSWVDFLQQQIEADASGNSSNHTGAANSGATGPSNAAHGVTPSFPAAPAGASFLQQAQQHAQQPHPQQPQPQQYTQPIL